MKKVFLTLALVFATGTIMNANSNKKELLFGECTQAAWDWEQQWDLVMKLQNIYKPTSIFQYAQLM